MDHSMPSVSVLEYFYQGDNVIIMNIILLSVFRANTRNIFVDTCNIFITNAVLFSRLSKAWVLMYEN